MIISIELGVVIAIIAGLQAPTWTILLWVLKVQRSSCLTLQNLDTKDKIYHPHGAMPGIE